MKKLFRKILRFFTNLISKFNVLYWLTFTLFITLSYILILLALVVDIIAPGTVNIVANLAAFFGAGREAGLAGLIILVFMVYFGVLKPFMVLSAVYSAGGINRDMISRVERQNRLDLWFWPSLMIGTWFLVLLSSFIVISPNQGIAIWIVTMGAFLLASFYFR